DLDEARHRTGRIVPDCQRTVVAELAVPHHVHTEIGDGGKQPEVPARIADLRVAEAAGESEPEHLAVEPGVGRRSLCDSGGGDVEATRSRERPQLGSPGPHGTAAGAYTPDAARPRAVHL